MNQPLSQRAARRLMLALLLFLLAAPLAARRQPLIVTYHNIAAFLTKTHQESEQKLLDRINDAGFGVYRCPAP